MFKDIKDRILDFIETLKESTSSIKNVRESRPVITFLGTIVVLLLLIVGYFTFSVIFENFGPTPTNTPTPTPTDTPTPMPTDTPIPMPSPTPIIGVITIGSLNVRSGPSVDYPIRGAVHNGDNVIVTGRIEDESWIYIADPVEGWISNNSKYVKVSPTAAVIISVTGRPTGTAPCTLKPRADQISGRIGPGESKDCFFVADNQSTTVVFAFRPNGRARFEVSSFENNDWKPLVIPPLENVGNLSGDRNTGELHWAGGGVEGIRHRLRLYNDSVGAIDYCLMTGDVNSWLCLP